DGNEIPYQPWARTKQQENLKNRMVVKVAADPSRYDTGDRELQCYRPGALRTIHMTSDDEAPGDTWMGWSNGKWDGESLVVNVSGFNGNTWLDRAGNFHSDAL